jgi:drug/metabolite transporter (DMT)-like permease
MRFGTRSAAWFLVTHPYPLSQTIDAGSTGPGDEAPPHRTFAMALMLMSSAAISFGALIIRTMERPDPWQINFYRSLALIAAILSILVFQYRGSTTSYLRNIGGAGWFGGAMLAASGIAFVQALTHTTVASTLFTQSAIPFVTAALARVILKEAVERATAVTMLVAAAGILAILADGSGIGTTYGNGMALVSTVCFSSFAVTVRRNRQVDMLATVLVSGLIIALVALLVRWNGLGISWHDLLLCLVWGGLLSGFANWMFILASRHLAAAEVTLFMLFEFALGTFWVWAFVGEAPRQWTLLGGSLVAAAVIGRSVVELRRTSRPAKRGRPSPL